VCVFLRCARRPAPLGALCLPRACRAPRRLTAQPWTFRPGGLACRSLACRCRSSFRGTLRLACERLLGRCTSAFALQRTGSRARSARSRPGRSSRRAARILCAALGLGLCRCRRRWQLDASTSRLRQADGDRLFRGSSSVFAFAYVMDFLADERAGLCRGRPSSTLRLARAFNSGLLRHSYPPKGGAGATRVPAELLS
jgi:hypothetical protein